MHSIVKSKDVVGVTVKNHQDECLGKVKELAINKQDGNVQYVVLTSGGFLGFGEKYYALPWSIFTYDDKVDCFRIGVSKDVIEASPGFKSDNWPDMSDTKWRHDVDDYYKQL